MTFKIGDRVKVVLPGSKDDGAIGVIVENTHAGEPWARYLRARLTSGPCEGLHGLYRGFELVPVAPRGPKPLTLNGGRPRFTVTAGLTVRKPPRHWTNDMWLLRAPGRER